MRVLFIGDIVGRPGREAVAALVPRLRRERGLDFVVANAENAAAGAGLTARLAAEILDAGVDALTLGDHVWDQRGFEQEIGGLVRVCRPANLPAAQPGRTHLVLESNGLRLLVVTVLGRVFMGPAVACPFATVDAVLAARAEGVAAVLVEIHAEATAEKVALGWHLAGRASAVVGTHTHIATADARVLPGGTAYQTDVGMTGPYASVLGREVRPVVAKFLDGLPRRFEVATEDVQLRGVEVEIDPADGRALGVTPVAVPVEAVPRAGGREEGAAGS